MRDKCISKIIFILKEIYNLLDIYRILSYVMIKLIVYIFITSKE